MRHTYNVNPGADRGAGEWDFAPPPKMCCAFKKKIKKRGRGKGRDEYGKMERKIEREKKRDKESREL